MNKPRTHIPVGTLWGLLNEAELVIELCRLELKSENKKLSLGYQGALSVGLHFEEKIKEILKQDKRTEALFLAIDNQEKT